ncbi:MAG: alpha/beta fold hydrolase [Eubacteriales bacterium]|nr:alpha/beta fold hydrolase [Eubacteriales bacterium]
MTNITNFTFLSTDGKTTLHGTAWLPADREIVAVLQIAHGLTEYVGRYDGFARFLNEQGIAVFGHDHLGHGLSLPEGAVPIYFGDGNTWDTVVDDMYRLHLRIKEQFPDKPLFLMGHSMGSFLARTYLIRYSGTVRAAIIMGTAWQSEVTLTAGLLVAKILTCIHGESSAPALVTALTFGVYNKAFAPTRTRCDWLTADTENVDRCMADPMCGQPITTGLMREMLLGIRFNQKREHLQKMDKNCPILLISGKDDPVGNMGKGVQHTYDIFRSHGIADVTLQLYDGLRHEILNEGSKRDIVHRDIMDWLRRCL